MLGERINLGINLAKLFLFRTVSARQRFSWGRSDILTNLKAYQATAGLRGYGAIRSFCDQNFMNGQTVREINSLRQDFKDALGDLGYLSGPVSSLSENDNNENLLKAILVGGLFPRVAAIRLPEARFEKLQAGSLQKDVRIIIRGGRYRVLS